MKYTLSKVKLYLTPRISKLTHGEIFRLAVKLLDRKGDVRLPKKRNSNSHDARPVHLIITMIKWIRTSRLSVKSSLYLM